MTMAHVEVLAAERRRRWSRSEKEQLVAASLEPGVSASEVARAAGIHVSQLFRWRKQLCERVDPMGGRGEALGAHNARHGREPSGLFYTHLSSRLAPFHAQAIPPSGEAAYVIDGLLYHEADLGIGVHHRMVGA